MKSAVPPIACIVCCVGDCSGCVYCYHSALAPSAGTDGTTMAHHDRAIDRRIISIVGIVGTVCMRAQPSAEADGRRVQVSIMREIGWRATNGWVELGDGGAMGPCALQLPDVLERDLFSSLSSSM